MKQPSTPLRSFPLAALCVLSCAGSTPPPATPAASSGAASSGAANSRAAADARSTAPGQDTMAPQAILGAPDWLPNEAREMLASRMQRHGEELLLLLVSVMTLHHEETERLAEQVAAEPRLGRPSPGESGTISSLLPERFFDLQEELQVRARAMAEAARTKDDTRIVRAYGQLAETCVSCHSVYLNADEPAEVPGD